MSSVEKGHIKDLRVPKVLYLLNSLEKTGVLLLQRGDVKKTVFFRNGRIVDTRSNALNDCLGQLLFHNGAITKTALEDSIRILDGTRYGQGELLVRMGYLSAEELQTWLFRQQSERIWGAFHWVSGDYAFHENPVPPRGVRESDPIRIIHDGIYQKLTTDFLKRELTLMHLWHYVRDDTLERVSSDVTIDPAERDFFLHLKPDGKVEEMLSSTRLDDTARYRFLYFAIHVGLIETSADRAALRTGGTSRKIEAFGVADQLRQILAEYNNKNFYEVLGVSPQAAGDQIKDAYFSLAAQYHPDRFGNQSEETRKLAEQVFTFINSAYSTLSDESARQAYDATYIHAAQTGDSGVDMQSIVNAEISYSKGMNFLKRKEYSSALKAFQQALELNPKEADYLAHVGWAMFKDGTTAGSKEKAKDFLKKALEANPKLDRAYVFLGNLLKSEGQIEKAEQQFELALKFNPDNIDAMREMRMSATRREKDQTIWKKIFKK